VLREGWLCADAKHKGRFLVLYDDGKLCEYFDESKHESALTLAIDCDTISSVAEIVVDAKERFVLKLRIKHETLLLAFDQRDDAEVWSALLAEFVQK
jgi:hypothetical protein